MLEEINRLPRKLIKDLDLNLSNFKVYLVQDFDLLLLENMVNFGLNIFGELGMNEWGLVPQIRHGSVYILKEDDKTDIVGLAILMRDWENTEKAYLFDFAIEKEMQGHGFGRQFLKIIAENLQEQDFKKISLTVDVENQSAIHLYRHIGFKPVEYSPNEYGEGHNRYIMEWELKDSKAREKVIYNS
ncbi:GNAT family N-acetyltransferase [Clostridium aminobutyricum]|uniref:GNAT family N-acetyltransferase n=2 Tax=Clostridium aminobutyricum TaxID=33953 RepID=A0A939D632_CLOAM|nr:GNAT family N-acetyltransferase [Clostridium aminobutyricum]